MAVKTARNGIVTLKDGTGTPKTLELTFDGEFTVDIPGTDIIFHKDRGVFGATPETSLGEDQPMTGSFNAKVKKLTDAAAATAVDVFAALAGAGFMGTSPWASTVTGSQRLLVDIVYTDGTTTWAFEDSAITGKFQEGTEADMASFSFTSPHPYPTIT